MSTEEPTNREKMETDLGTHKQVKKELIPPFKQIGMTHSSWIHSRMPEMLWAVLAIGNLPRKNALNLFRHVGAYVEKNNECWDCRISAIAILS